MRFVMIVAAAGLIAGSAFGILTTPAATAERPTGTEPAPLSDRPDIGTGERLMLVIAGNYAGRMQAEAANAAFRFGDMQGFVVAPSDDFTGLAPRRWLILSAFRTVGGAAEFEDLARMAGATSLRRIVAVYRGTAWIGLGQEASPDGTGPLVGPLAPGHSERL